jgi:phospholipase/lecithinase/hemolysin
MRGVSFKAALAAVPIFVFAPLEAAFGWGQVRVVAFGYSLMDAGTYAPFASQFTGQPLSNSGRFTTNPGLNFAQDIASFYGDTLTPAFVGGFRQDVSKRCLKPSGGLDYAQGGSRVALQPGINYAPNCAQATTVPVKDQVGLYLSAYKKFASNQLVLINGGAYDVLYQLAIAEAVGTPQALLAASEAIAQAAVNLSKIVETVVAKGAAHVVVFNLPDIGKTPAGVASPDNGQLLTEVSKLFNATLAFALRLEHHKFIGKVILIDASGFVDYLVANGNFQKHGFSVSNTGIACNLVAQAAIAASLCPKPANGSLYCTNPALFGSSLFCSPSTYNTSNKAPDPANDYIFADEIHPTTHTNALFAAYVEKRIVASGW